MGPTLDIKKIEQLLPVTRNYYEDWNIRIFDRKENACRNYLSPNRRDFYKILFVTAGEGNFTIGVNSYHITRPTILFIHPNEIISWKNLSKESGGHFCLFKKRYFDMHPVFKGAINKYKMFSEPEKSVILLKDDSVNAIDGLFLKMHLEDKTDSFWSEDMLQAYLQLIVIESAKSTEYSQPEKINEDYKHIYNFFALLESESAEINFNTPIRIRTVKEFANQLNLHPNYLNSILKKYTGQNASMHLKSKLLDESKALLLQTDWSLQEIGYAVGFADQPNFSQFFKKNVGITPNEFRKNDFNEV